MKRLIDTNALLDYPQLAKEKDVCITLPVLQELDRLKLAEKETGQKARAAIQFIRTYQEEIDFLSDAAEGYTDDYLLNTASQNNYSIITSDIILELKCKAKGVQCEVPNSSFNINGIYYLSVPDDNETISEIYSGNIPFKIHPNEYVCIFDSNQESGYKDILQYKNGKLKSIYPQTIVNQGETIKPLNPEQVCLFNSLYDKDISIIYAGGLWGTGKTFCITSFALQELEKGHINKIVYVPNNAINENTRDPGALPGTLFEKESVFLGSLIDLTSKLQVEDMVYNEQLEIMPITFARGRNIDDAIIIVNEAQNLTEEHIKLLIARCGKRTRICFDGDIRQADSHVFRTHNGLKLLLKLKDSEEFAPIFSSVNLRTIERSKTAQAAAFLDEIQY